jgi:hypothetical protein
MSRYSGSLFTIFIILISLALAPGVAVGQSPVPPTEVPTPAATLLPSPTPTPSLEERLDSLEGEAKALRADIEARSIDWVTLGIGLAGILSTLIVSSLGLYFTHKARTSKYREELYSTQIELIIELFELIDAVTSASKAVMDAEDKESHFDAWYEFKSQVLSLSDSLSRSSAILPTELFTALGQLHSSAVDFLYVSTQKEDVESDYHVLRGFDVKFALLAREFIGVDALSEESTKLFARNLRGVLEAPIENLAAASKLLLEKWYEQHKRKRLLDENDPSASAETTDSTGD